MNCFEWHTHLSDYLDGALIGPLKRDADQHLSECRACEERLKHIRVLLTTLVNQPRETLPVAVRKSPFHAPVPKLNLFGDTFFSRSRWERIPWFVRTPLEGAAIVLLVLAAVSAGPMIRSLYERNIEKSLSEYNDPTRNQNSNVDKAAQQAPLARGNVGTSPIGSASQDQVDESADESVSGDDETLAGGSGSDDDNVQAGQSEVWRFSMKTDSPMDMRHKVVQTLRDLRVPPNTEGFGGIEVPGGIQFDLLVPQSIVNPLKRQLQKMAPKAGAKNADDNAAVSENFTWYKNKAKRKIPAGKTRIVIWLSQI